MWINWSPNDDGIDPRVTNWILGFTEKAMAKYWDEQYDYEQVLRAESENRERDELARLKAKFEGNT